MTRIAVFPQLALVSAVSAAIAVSAVNTLLAQPAPARWTLDAAPLLTLGASQADTNDSFAEVVGATRFPDGRVLVGDVGGWALRLFEADGRFIRRFGRKGGGPGEIGYLKNLLRCGDSLVTLDIDGNRTSVFALGGQFVRVFRFASPQAPRPPYKSVCNSRGDFAHYGWENVSDAKGGAYRHTVPLWVSRTDSASKPAIASIPGSERFGMVVDRRFSGSRPLPLGKQTALAIGNDRVYVASGDRFEIAVYDFAGNLVTSMREERSPVPTSRADIVYERERQLALLPDGRLAQAAIAFEELPFPKTLPTYSALVLDANGYLWAMEHPRGAATTSTWQVYDTTGKRVAAATVPKHLDIYEIGSDYVLGRYLDPDEGVPLVRLYRLRR